MDNLRKVLTSQGYPAGFADTLPAHVKARLEECIQGGQLVSDARDRVGRIMRQHYESQKAVVDPPGV